MQFSIINRVRSRIQGEGQSKTSISLSKQKSLSESESEIYSLSIAERFLAAISNKKRTAKSEI